MVVEWKQRRSCGPQKARRWRPSANAALKRCAAVDLNEFPVFNALQVVLLGADDKRHIHGGMTHVALKIVCQRWVVGMPTRVIFPFPHASRSAIARPSLLQFLDPLRELLALFLQICRGAPFVHEAFLQEVQPSLRRPQHLILLLALAFDLLTLSFDLVTQPHALFLDCAHITGSSRLLARNFVMMGTLSSAIRCQICHLLTIPASVDGNIAHSFAQCGNLQLQRFIFSRQSCLTYR